MKQDNRTRLGTIKKLDGNYTNTPEETLEELLKVLFPDLEVEENRKELHENSDTNELLDIEEMINTKALKTAIESFKPYKSPGPDGIYPVLLQKGLEELTPFLLSMYKESIKEKRPAKPWLDQEQSSYPNQGSQTTQIQSPIGQSASAPSS